MLENGYSLNFQDKSCIIYDGSRNQILEVGMKDKSFVIEWKRNENKSSDESKLWHKRLGHFNYDI